MVKINKIRVQDDLSIEVVDEEEALRLSEDMVEKMNEEQRNAFGLLIEAAVLGEQAPQNCFFLEVSERINFID